MRCISATRCNLQCRNMFIMHSDKASLYMIHGASSYVCRTVCGYRHVTKHYKRLGLPHCLWVQTCHKALQAAGSAALSVGTDMSQSTTSGWVCRTVYGYRHVTKHYKRLGLPHCLWVQTCHKALQAAGSAALSMGTDMSQSTTSGWVCRTVYGYRHVTKHYKQLRLPHCLWVQTCHKALQAAGSAALSMGIDMSQSTTSSYVCRTVCGYRHVTKHYKRLGLPHCLWVQTCHKALQAAGSAALSMGTDMSQSTTSGWVCRTVYGYRHVTKHYKRLGLPYCLWVQTCHKALRAATSATLSVGTDMSQCTTSSYVCRTVCGYRHVTKHYKRLGLPHCLWV